MDGLPFHDLDVDVSLRSILEGTATETGERFFAALVQNLAKALGTFVEADEERALAAPARGLGELAGEQADAVEHDPGGAGRGDREAARGGGDLLADEVVKGDVGVERAHEVVAVAPRLGPVRIVFETIAFREPYHVQPVLSPPLTVSRRGEPSRLGRRPT